MTAEATPAVGSVARGVLEQQLQEATDKLNGTLDWLREYEAERVEGEKRVADLRAAIADLDAATGRSS